MGAGQHLGTLFHAPPAIDPHVAERVEQGGIVRGGLKRSPQFGLGLLNPTERQEREAADLADLRKSPGTVRAWVVDDAKRFFMTTEVFQLDRQQSENLRIARCRPARTLEGRERLDRALLARIAQTDAELRLGIADRIVRPHPFKRRASLVLPGSGSQHLSKLKGDLVVIVKSLRHPEVDHDLRTSFGAGAEKDRRVSEGLGRQLGRRGRSRRAGLHQLAGFRFGIRPGRRDGVQHTPIVGKRLGIPAAALQEVGIVPCEQLGRDRNLEQGLKGRLRLGVATACLQQTGLLMQQDQGGRVAGRQRHRPEGCGPVVRCGGDRCAHQARRQGECRIKITRVQDRQTGLRIAALNGEDRAGQPGRISEFRVAQKLG